MYVCMYVYVHMYVYMYVRMYVCMYVCLFACLHVQGVCIYYRYNRVQKHNCNYVCNNGVITITVIITMEK